MVFIIKHKLNDEAELNRLKKKFPFVCYVAPVVAKHDLTVRYLYPGRLSAVEKNRHWIDLKLNQPAYADLLKNDPNLKELIATFDAEIVEEISNK